MGQGHIRVDMTHAGNPARVSTLPTEKEALRHTALRSC